MKKISAVFISVLMLAACSNKPEPIIYGKDICTSCKMTIMDQKFGAELVSSKGKIIKFDSGECMLTYLKMEEALASSKKLVANYANPGELIEADGAIYLHGGNINSPMGGNLAAFKTSSEAEKFQTELGGDLILWDKAMQINF